ncbi:Peptidase [Seinonella peptonophila]|uniref:Peptidase n=1 Tax=Seinonella peptonophila TaxID=112248 RepID=A0A1M4X8N3_9BACL|nr:basic secretory protein-like protein [Seinonella peptonophila]SHE89816.1 Peptidase [Seinonella peptonophila]
MVVNRNARLLLLSLIWVCSILVVQTSNVYAGEQPSSYSLVFEDKIDAKYESLIRNEFRRVYPKLVATFNPNAPKLVKVKVDNSKPEWAGYYRFDQPDTIYLNMKAVPQELDASSFRVIDHELAHLVQAYDPSTPLWIAEGMADYATILLGDGMTDISIPVHPKPGSTFQSEIEEKKYREAARFLIWAKNYKRSTIIEEINRYARQKINFTGSDQLWEEYFKNPVTVEKNPQCYAKGEKNCPDLTNGKNESYNPLTKEPEGLDQAIVKKTAYLNQKPGASNSVAQVEAASSVQLICQTNGSPILGDDSQVNQSWTYIKAGKNKGYIPTIYLKINPAGPIIPPCPNPSIENNTEVRHLVQSDTTLHKKPDQNSAILANLKKGTEANILCVKPGKQVIFGNRIQNDWYHVQTGKQQGYLSALFIHTKKGESFPECGGKSKKTSESQKAKGNANQ